MDHVALLDIFGAVFWGLAFVSAFRLRRKHLNKISRLFLCLLLGTYFVVELSNLLEHAGITDYFDRFEDYLEIIFLPLFLFFLFANHTWQELQKRRETEVALQESEELYRSLVENVDLGVTLIDRNHKIIMTNQAQGRLFQKSIESFVGKSCFIEFEKRDKVCPHCPGVLTMESGKPQEAVAEGVTDDGHTFTVRIQAFPWRKDGLIQGFIEVVENITERIEADNILAEERERLAVTLRSIGDGVITTDTQGNILLINKAAEQLTGWSQEEVVGRDLLEIFVICNEKTRKPCSSPVDKVLKTEGIVTLDNPTILIAKDGTERIIADSGAPILDKKSRVIGVVLVFRDVTEKYRMESELQKNKKIEAIGILAGGIAHDFNNILFAILGNIDLATLKMGQEEKGVQKLLGDAKKAVIRAQNLTQQLLTFSKGGDPIKQASSISEVIRDSANFILRGSNISCQYDIPDDLWLADIDKNQISQVIQNIILNGVYAMPSGGFISVACSNITIEDELDPLLSDGDYIWIKITDNGIGIPREFLNQIFDPYFSTKQQGSGLGLAITHSIVQKHHGKISVESTVGEGTSFTIHLPAMKDKTLITAKEETGLKPLHGSGRVLVMDDQEMIRQLSQTILSYLGYEVVTVADGQLALEEYQNASDTGKPFDLVLLDITIPGGMGGQETIKELLALDPAVNAIVASGYSNDRILANYKDFGFKGSIVKPYQVQELSQLIDKILNVK